MLSDLKAARLSISKDARPVYDALVAPAKSKAEQAPFSRFKDLFVAAACIGAHYDAFRVPSSKEQVFAGSVLDDDSDIPVLLALAYKRAQNLESLLEVKQVVEIAEGWAEGGIGILKEKLIDTPGPPPLLLLTDFIEEHAKALY